jgi:two-component system uhpT operon response regulator UhpA
MPTILLIDDHAIVREGFKRLFEGDTGFTVVAEAHSVDEALAAAHRHRPDIAVIDLSLGLGGNGMALVTQLAEELPAMKRVVVSMHDEPALVLRALDSGADGYVTKALAADELPGLLRRVVEGEIALSSDLAASTTSTAGNSLRLTPRECETLRGLLSDLPPKAVAADLGISDKTLYRHRANLMEKLGARTTAELARIARERGLLAMLEETPKR